MSPSLANRLLAVREERFVGREAEQNLFASALTAAQLPFNVLFVHGPGGIGKTSLLRAFLRTCESLGVTAVSLDARNLEPTPDSFLTALGDALELAPTPLTLELLRVDIGRCVVLVDTYEVLGPLDTWLRESFLPELPEQALIVFAGRNPPTPPWRVDPGWQSLVRVVGLQNLSSEEARRYLASQQIPEDASRAALEFTHGHPLALSLVVDVLRQQPGVTFEPRQEPDVIGILLEQFVHDIPGAVHRAAIEGSALLRVTTQALLAEVLDAPDVHDVFEWLRDLSFMEAGPLGLFPHDLAREALSADLRWRDPDRFAEMHRRAREHYRGRSPERVDGSSSGSSRTTCTCIATIPHCGRSSIGRRPVRGSRTRPRPRTSPGCSRWSGCTRERMRPSWQRSGWSAVRPTRWWYAGRIANRSVS